MLVVVRISEQRCVGEHDRGVAFVPVAEVVGKSHLGHDKREGGNRVSGECVIESGEEGGRLLVADNGDVVANCRVDSTGASEGECFFRHPVERGQFLRTGLVCEIPEAFEADHALDVVAVLPAGLGMNAAAHRLVGEMGRLLACVGDEADISWRILGLHEEARCFEQESLGISAAGACLAKSSV